jgi:hypothetical protein
MHGTLAQRGGGAAPSSHAVKRNMARSACRPAPVKSKQNKNDASSCFGPGGGSQFERYPFLSSRLGSSSVMSSSCEQRLCYNAAGVPDGLALNNNSLVNKKYILVESTPQRICKTIRIIPLKLA